MLPIGGRAVKTMANASSARASGLRPVAKPSQRTSVIVSVVRKEGVRKKFMTDVSERYPSNDKTERFTSGARGRPATPAKPASTRVRDRFKDEDEPAKPDSSWNGTGGSNGNGVPPKPSSPVEKRVPSPRSSASPRTRRGSPSRFESGMERLPEVPSTSNQTVNDITERFMSRARDRPATSPPKPPAPRAPEPTASFVAAERARSPDPMRSPRSAERSTSRGRVRDRFMDPPPPPTPTLPPPPPPMKQQAQSYTAPTRTASRTPSPIRRSKRMGPTAQRLALISQEQTKDANQPVPAPSYIDVEPLPTNSPWPNLLPSLKGIPLFDIMSFDGAGPEVINGRVAMLGFFSMLCTEFVTGETALEQYVYTADSLPYMFVIWTVASLVPLLRGVDVEKASWGPFTPLAEKFNGRAAMVGLVGVVIFEALKGRALFF